MGCSTIVVEEEEEDDACTKGTSQILTLASLQRLKMEALIAVPAYGEVRSVKKIFNTQSTAPIEIQHAGLVFREFRVDQIPGVDQIDCGSFRGFPQ